MTMVEVLIAEKLVGMPGAVVSTRVTLPPPPPPPPDD